MEEGVSHFLAKGETLKGARGRPAMGSPHTHSHPIYKVAVVQELGVSAEVNEMSCVPI